MENFNYIWAGQNCFKIVVKTVIEGLNFLKVEDVAMSFIGQLEQWDWSFFDVALAVDAEHRRYRACQYFPAQILNFFLRLNEGVLIFRYLWC